MKGPVSGTQFYIGRAREVFSAHIDACSESRSPVGACANTALHLDVFYRTGKVGQVNPVERMALSVVERYAIIRDIDARGISAAHTNGGIAYAIASITRSNYAWRARQEKRDVLPVILSFQFSLSNRAESNGGCGLCAG